MISAFAKAAQILDEPRYLAAAQRATQFILTRMYDDATGVLQRRFREGEAAIHGFLDDLEVAQCRPFEEALILKAADAYQQATDWHLRVPPLVA